MAKPRGTEEDLGTRGLQHVVPRGFQQFAPRLGSWRLLEVGPPPSRGGGGGGAVETSHFAHVLTLPVALFLEPKVRPERFLPLAFWCMFVCLKLPNLTSMYGRMPYGIHSLMVGRHQILRYLSW